MSYAGPSRTERSHRSARAASTPASGASHLGASAAYVPYGADLRGETDWQEVALFGAGVALGVLLGAGGALLTAPRTGAETRAALTARAARLRRTTSRRSHDAWDDLRDELRQARRALRRRKQTVSE
jgi:uncharacterized membrane protein YfcA